MLFRSSIDKNIVSGGDIEQTITVEPTVNTESVANPETANVEDEKKKKMNDDNVVIVNTDASADGNIGNTNDNTTDNTTDNTSEDNTQTQSIEVPSSESHDEQQSETALNEQQPEISHEEQIEEHTTNAESLYLTPEEEERERANVENTANTQIGAHIEETKLRVNEEDITNDDDNDDIISNSDTDESDEETSDESDDDDIDLDENLHEISHEDLTNNSKSIIETNAIYMADGDIDDSDTDESDEETSDESDDDDDDVEVDNKPRDDKTNDDKMMVEDIIAETSKHVDRNQNTNPEEVDDGDYSNMSSDFLSGGTDLSELMEKILEGGYKESSFNFDDYVEDSDNSVNDDEPTPFVGGSKTIVNKYKIINTFPYVIKTKPTVL